MRNHIGLAIAMLMVAGAGTTFWTSGGIESGRVCAAGGHESAGVGDDESDLAEHDEIRRTVELAPGADVEVWTISGRVEIVSTAGSMAEVHVVRSARKRADLEHRKITVEETGGTLKIHGEEERGRTPDVRVRVMLKVPRNINLSVRGVNGRVTAGEIDGAIHVSGVNGSVDVAHAATTSKISGINGRVRIGLDRLGSDGITISGVNGNVELRFAEALNAEISVTGINGHVFADGAPIVVVGKVNPSSFTGRIGAGGPMVKVTGVNGNVELLGSGGRL